MFKKLLGAYLACLSYFNIPLAHGQAITASVDSSQNGKLVYIRTAASLPVNKSSINSNPSLNKITQLKLSGVKNVKPQSGAAVEDNQTVSSGALTAPINFPKTGCLYTWTNNTPGIGLPAAGVNDIPSFTAVNTGAASVTATITVNPQVSGFAYIPNVSTDNVSVIATATNNVVATIPVGDGPFAVSVSPDGSHAYIANINSNTVSVIATASNTVIATIPVGNSPQGLVVSPDGTRLYVLNARSNFLSVVNTVNNSVVSTISVGSRPQGIAISPDGSKLYISDGDSYSVLVINTTSASTIADIPVEGNPLALAITPDGSRVYVGGLYGGVTVLNAVTNALLTTINTGVTPSWIAISPDGKKAYVTDPTGSTVNVINITDNTVSAIISIPTHPQGISITPDGKSLFVTDRGNSAFVINTTTLAVTASMQVGEYPVAIGNFITPPLACNSAPKTYNITVNPGSPVISASENVNAVNTTYGIPSASVSFTVSAGGLSAGITVTPPPGFEISADNINFSNTITVGGANMTTPVTVYIRLAAKTNVGAYSGNIVLRSIGAADVNVNIPNSTVVPSVLNITGSYGKLYGDVLADYTLTANTPGVTFNPAGLRNNDKFKFVKIAFANGAGATAPVGTYTGSVTLSDFQGDNGFLPANYTINYFPIDLVVLPAPITIAAADVNKPYGNTLNNTTVSSGFTVTGLKNNETIGTVSISYGQGATALSPPGLYIGSIVPSGAAAGSFSPGNYSIIYQPGNLTVNAPPPPLLSYSGIPLALQTVYGTSSASTSISVLGQNLVSAVIVSPPAGFELSTDNSNFSSMVTLMADAAGTLTLTTIYIRLAAITPVGNYNGNLMISNTGLGTINIPLSGTVTPASLVVTVKPVVKTYGTSAGSAAFAASGLQNGETIGSLTLIYGPGSAAGDAAGVYNNAVVPEAATGGSFNSANYAIKYVAGTITVNPASLTIIADNTSRAIGMENPEFKLTYTGFVNNEGPAQLTTLPVVSAMAVISSPTGQYPIIASGASSANYDITYIPGILTVYAAPQNIKVPNTFTPNGDGANDSWMIKDLQYYPNCTVEIYNRYGQHLFHSRGYSRPWDGTYNNQPVPFGVYYYIISLNDGSPVRLSGYVAIAR